MVGTIIDSKYRVTGVLEETSDMLVFDAVDIETNQRVTIRSPRALGGATPEELMAGFKFFSDEAEKLARVTAASTDVEKLVGWGVSEAMAYCAFEHVPGITLADKLRSGKGMSLSKAIALLDPIARALAAAHVLGIHHGDIRPENMLYGDRYGETSLVLGHWVLGSRLEPGNRFLAEYGAPEHFRKTYGAVGPTTDVYGLALVFIEVVSGRRALEGEDHTELSQRTTNSVSRPTLRSRGVVTPDSIEAALQKALAVQQKDRFSTARMFWDALSEARSQAGLPAPGDISLPSLPMLPEVTDSPSLPSSPSYPSQPSYASHPSHPSNASYPSSPSSPSQPSYASHPSQASQPSYPSHVRNVAPAAQGSPFPPWMLAVGAAGAALLVTGIVVRLATKSEAAPPPHLQPSAVPSTTANAIVTPSASGSSPSTKSSPEDPAPPSMVLVPAGTFTMGTDKEGPGDRPAHRVTLTHAFYIDRKEVSANAYKACQDTGTCTARNVHPKRGFAASVYGCNLEEDRGDHPANCVDWEQAKTYCKWAQARLPTEAEWEYAAKGTDDREYPWGNGPPTSCTQLVVSGGPCGTKKSTSPVGSTTDGASPFGLFDMAGNVWEWVQDGFTPYVAGDVTDPPPPPLKQSKAVVRGGSFDYSPSAAKTTYRMGYFTEAGNASIGFRCARDE